MLLSGIQIVPFVEDAGKANVFFGGIWRSLVTEQLQGASVRFGRLMKLVF